MSLEGGKIAASLTPLPVDNAHPRWGRYLLSGRLLVVSSFQCCIVWAECGPLGVLRVLGWLVRKVYGLEMTIGVVLCRCRHTVSWHTKSKHALTCTIALFGRHFSCLQRASSQYSNNEQTHRCSDLSHDMTRNPTDPAHTLPDKALVYHNSSQAQISNKP